MATPIRVFVVDDHALVRAGIIALILDNDEIEFVGEADTGESAIAKIFELVPDVVLLDISLPDISGIEVLKRVRVRKFCDVTRFLIITMFDTHQYYYRAIKSGALGVIGKNTTQYELLKGISLVSKGQMYFGESVTVTEVQKIIVDLERTNFKELDPENVFLTRREYGVLRLLLNGLSSRDISEKLELSPRTVEIYRSNLLHKFNVITPVELIALINSNEKLRRKFNSPEE